jgi:DinI-like family
MLAEGGSKTARHIDPALSQTIAKKLKDKYKGKAIEITGAEQMRSDLSDHDRQRIIHMLQTVWTAGKVEKQA